MSFIRPFLARWIAALVATFAGWASTKLGVVLDPDTQAELVTSIVTQVFVVFSVLYPLIHKLISARTNPTDAAKPTVIENSAILAEQRGL